MTHFHAALWMDHHRAILVTFNADTADVHHIKSHADDRHHGHAHLQLDHKFLAALCDAITPPQRVILCGPGTAKTEFRDFLAKKHPLLLGRIVGIETMDHPTDRELTAFARATMDRIDRMLPTG